MARKRMITRVVNLTHGEVLVVNLKTRQTDIEKFTIVGSIVNSEKILERITNKLVINGDVDIKPVQIITSEVVEKMFGITENDFIKYGVELDRNTRKPITKEEVEEVLNEYEELEELLNYEEVEEIDIEE